MTHARILLVAAALAASAFAQPLRYTPLDTGAVRPAGRIDGTIAFDAAGRQIFLFGGDADSGTRNDLWAYSLDRKEWIEITAPGAPAARFGHTLIADAPRRRLIVFGGQAGGFFNDTWSFDIAASTWTRLDAGTGPSKRYGHSAIYDGAREQMVISHGFTDAGRFDDTWAFDLRTNRWRDISPSSGRPVRRCLHHATADAAGDQMLLFGGCASGTPMPNNCPLGDLWSFDLRTNRWTEVTSNPRPQPRQWYGTAFDAARRRMIVFGGSGGGSLNDTWEFDPVARSWSQTQVSGEVPAARNRHEGTYVPALDGVVFFGGRVGFAASNELLLFSSAAPRLPEVSGGAFGVFRVAATPFAPGQIVSLYGRALGPDTGVIAAFDSNGRLPVSLGGTEVTFNGVRAPLYFVHASQINLQVPYEVAGAAMAEVAVRTSQGAGATLRVAISSTSPDLFGGVLNQDGSLNSAANPSSRGQAVVLFASGTGVTSPATMSGAVATVPLAPPAVPVRLFIGGQEARLLFAASAPGTAGLVQINAVVPDGVAGDRVPVSLEAAGVRSQETAIAIR